MTDGIKKRILIYAHYYFPDVAATGQLLQELSEGLVEEFDVTVICTVPSYTGSIKNVYKEKKIYNEKINGVRVLRVPVPVFRKTSKFSRIKNILSYYYEARNITKSAGNQDYVLAISQPPILGGMLGIYGKKSLHTTGNNHPKLIYCIQDYNPEQIDAVKYIKSKLILNLLMWLDKRSCRSADLIITVGKDLIETLKNRFRNSPMPKYTLINNWVDEKEIHPLRFDDPGVLKFKQRYDLKDKFIIMYCGNIGLYYDLEGIMIQVITKFRNAKTSDGREVVFAFVGEGSVRDKLVNFSRENQLNNVVFIPYQEKSELIFTLNAADVHWCVNASGIKGVSCPSKAYGIWAVKKPALGVLEKDSEIRSIYDKTGSALCCEPGDYDAIERNVQWFIDHAGDPILDEMAGKGYQYMLENYTKGLSIQKYKKAILES